MRTNLNKHEGQRRRFNEASRQFARAEAQLSGPSRRTYPPVRPADSGVWAEQVDTRGLRRSSVRSVRSVAAGSRPVVLPLGWAGHSLTQAWFELPSMGYAEWLSSKASQTPAVRILSVPVLRAE